ncbi:MAG: zf-HC2 domain-containing protein [Vicinamibacterales bacterium]
MCEQRERLISYVYDECEPQERQNVELHLSGCPTCRDEIGGLRRVRQDLLAWDVPEHGSVWKPFAPPAPKPSWRDVPAWALAAAAGLIFLAGAAGGVATRVLWPAMAAVPAEASSGAGSAMAPPATLAQIKADILAEVRAEVEQRPGSGPIQQHQSDAIPAHMVQGASGASPEVRQLTRRLAELEQDYQDWRNDQIRLNVQVNEKLVGLGTRTRTLSNMLDLSTHFQRISAAATEPAR